MIDLTLTDRLTTVRARIAAAAVRAGRPPEDVTLIAVTKTWPAEVVLAAYAAGQRHFGENRSDEFAGKRVQVAQAVTADKSADEPVWHFIGALQSRQTHAVADHADWFHAVDRLKIARRLSSRVQEGGRVLAVFLEVNVSGEASKAGFDCGRWEHDGGQRATLQTAAEAVAALPGLRPVGLMTMAPWGAPERVLRQTFARTRELAGWLQTAVPAADWSRLSMGMTDDFEIAIEEGASHVRVGRAIFGERE